MLVGSSAGYRWHDATIHLPDTAGSHLFREVLMAGFGSVCFESHRSYLILRPNRVRDQGILDQSDPKMECDEIKIIDWQQEYRS